MPKKPKLIKRAVSFRQHKRWEKRPTYKGYIIPYVALIDDKGAPNFQAVNMDKILDCVRNQKCGICGESFRREKWIAFIGGELCAEYFAFSDPGMHSECAYYSAETCPYLKNEAATYAKTPNLKCPEGAKVMLLNGVDKSVGRPKRMMILFAKGYTARQQRDHSLLIIAKRDGHRIDWDAMPESK